MTRICAVDFFCGAGGLTRGLLDAGIEVLAGYDIDEECRYPYEYNNNTKFIKKDIHQITKEEVENHFPKNCIKVLAGCAPCQPFSKYTQGIDTKSNHKWGLMGEFARLIKQINPDVVSMENVPESTRHEIFKFFLETLNELNYKIDYKIAYCPDYGIPQNRRRLILIASKKSKIEILPPTHKPCDYPTVRDAIGHLPKIKAGESHPTDPLHKSSRLSDINLKRIKASKPGNSWRNWSDDLILKCHKSKTGKTYPSVYGRMSWDKPAPTITTQFFGFGNGRFGHPEQNRAISLREGAIFQSFPNNYQFTKPDTTHTIRNIGRMIGNAVPVKLGKIIGESIVKTEKAEV